MNIYVLHAAGRFDDSGALTNRDLRNPCKRRSKTAGRSREDNSRDKATTGREEGKRAHLSERDAWLLENQIQEAERLARYAEQAEERARIRRMLEAHAPLSTPIDPRTIFSLIEEELVAPRWRGRQHLPLEMLARELLNTLSTFFPDDPSFDNLQSGADDDDWDDGGMWDDRHMGYIDPYETEPDDSESLNSVLVRHAFDDVTCPCGEIAGSDACTHSPDHRACVRCGHERMFCECSPLLGTSPVNAINPDDRGIGLTNRDRRGRKAALYR